MSVEHTTKNERISFSEPKYPSECASAPRSCGTKAKHLPRNRKSELYAFLGLATHQLHTLKKKLDLSASISTHVKMIIKITPYLWWSDNIICIHLTKYFKKCCTYECVQKDCWLLPKTHTGTSHYSHIQSLIEIYTIHI